MAGTDPLMVEKKSVFTILVVEDNREFGLNALQALSGHNAHLATCLEDALPAIKTLKPDLILSDVHFPTEPGGQPKENIVELMHAALGLCIPVCFVTQADHHGLTEKDEGFVSIKPVTISDLTKSLMVITRRKDDAALRQVSSSSTIIERSRVKTPEIWLKAFHALRNACDSESGALKDVILLVRKTLGVEIAVEKGLPVLKVPRKGT